MGFAELAPPVLTILGIAAVAAVFGLGWWSTRKFIKSDAPEWSDISKVRVGITIAFAVFVVWGMAVVNKVQPRNDASPTNYALEQNLREIDNAPPVTIEIVPTLTLDEKFNQKQGEFQADSEERKDAFMDQTPVKTE